MAEADARFQISTEGVMDVKDWDEIVTKCVIECLKADCDKMCDWMLKADCSHSTTSTISSQFGTGGVFGYCKLAQMLNLFVFVLVSIETRK